MPPGTPPTVRRGYSRFRRSNAKKPARVDRAAAARSAYERSAKLPVRALKGLSTGRGKKSAQLVQLSPEEQALLESASRDAEAQKRAAAAEKRAAASRVAAQRAEMEHRLAQAALGISLTDAALRKKASKSTSKSKSKSRRTSGRQIHSLRKD